MKWIKKQLIEKAKNTPLSTDEQLYSKRLDKRIGDLQSC